MRIMPRRRQMSPVTAKAKPRELLRAALDRKDGFSYLVWKRATDRNFTAVPVKRLALSISAPARKPTV